MIIWSEGQGEAMKLYSVVNMDIVASRYIKDRNRFQLDLSSYIERINEIYAGILSAPVAITLGDEWQLITSKPSESYNLVHEFQKFLWRFGNAAVKVYILQVFTEKLKDFRIIAGVIEKPLPFIADYDYKW